MVKDMEIKMERVLMEVWEEFSGVWRKIRLYEEIVEKQN